MTFDRMRLIAALALAGSLGGCVASNPLGDTAALTTRQSVQPMMAWASLSAAAGTPMRVIEESSPTSRLQRAAYPGGGTAVGENSLSVEIEGPDGANADLRHPPTEAMIARELNSAAPGLAWHRGTAPIANAYGPFGYAEGTTGNTACVYAWQWFDRSAMEVEGFSLVKKVKPVSIRMRMCDEIAASDLLDRMKSLRLSVGGLSVPLTAYSGPMGGDALTEAGSALGVATVAPAESYGADPVTETPVTRKKPAPVRAAAKSSVPPVAAGKTVAADTPVIPTVGSMTGAAPAVPSTVPANAGITAAKSTVSEADSGPRIPTPSAM
ncbi:hypothetical protein HDIA_4547 [Hartmannibacter diazotrophicus]|uniref:Cellulose biosynthesis protein BcsN n=1 Tax=Hartmannibacter diazotrophicus TaxID=1482074 RepID=A0A2C9DDA5_9HYPH|nr:cellulose biosynthesis protein BcsN [Hartmannibacter diazotrophicus]SON58088.1 hypothetical protein HDIA_4547 [Hartmannibacter diazotrophicus]